MLAEIQIMHLVDEIVRDATAPRSETTATTSVRREQRATRKRSRRQSRQRKQQSVAAPTSTSTSTPTATSSAASTRTASAYSGTRQRTGLRKRDRIRNAVATLLCRGHDDVVDTTAHVTSHHHHTQQQQRHRERHALAAHDVDALIHTATDADTDMDWDAIDGLVGDIAACSTPQMAMPLALALSHTTQDTLHVQGPLQLTDIRCGRVLGQGAFGTVKLAAVARGVFHTQDALKHGLKLAQTPLYALKIMDKSAIVARRAHANVLTEKHALVSIPTHPAIVTMHASFSDHNNLYVLMELLSGGDMYQLMSRQVLSMDTVRFYAAWTILGLQHIHAAHFVFRDLKTENLVLADDGYPKIVDFGLAKELHDDVTGAGPQHMRTFTMCGTPEYMAPEIFNKQGYNHAVDLWALGVLIYEMLVRHTPFVVAGDDAQYTKLKANIQRKAATNHRIRFPGILRQTAPDACDLVDRLLQADPESRIGVHNPDELREHAWFRGLDWDALLHKRLEPPHVPQPLCRGSTYDSDLDSVSSDDVDSESDCGGDDVRVSLFQQLPVAPLVPDDELDIFFADF